jgi:hypothetical protein
VAYLRLTMLQPRPGSEVEARELLEELDTSLVGADGLVFSLVMSQERKLGRVALWHSKDDANREATSDHVMSIRSRLRFLSLSTDETLLEVKSGHLPEGFGAIFNAPEMLAS